MSLATDTKNSETFTKQAYEAIAEMGGELPENKNLQNLAPTVSAMQTVPEGDGTLWGTLYRLGDPKGLVLDSKADYDACGNTASSIQIRSGGAAFKISKANVDKFSFGRLCSYTPDNFLFRCSNLKSLEYTEVLREIGPNFLSQCGLLNSSLDLPNVINIGNTFCYSCASFNNELIIPKVRLIGSGFMSSCISFSKSLALPASLEACGANLLADCRKFTGLLTIETTFVPSDDRTLTVSSNSDVAYQQGVRITGPGAAAWKEALPDRYSTTNGYRKLILVEEA